METENGRVWKAREDTSTRTLAFEIGKSDSDAAYIHAVHETVKVPVEETINAMAGMKLPHRLRNWDGVIIAQVEWGTLFNNWNL